MRGIPGTPAAETDTALTAAAKRGHVAVLELLAEFKADIKHEVRYHMRRVSAIFLALEFNKGPAADYLRDWTAQLHKIHRDHFVEAAQRNDIADMKELAKNPMANVNHVHSKVSCLCDYPFRLTQSNATVIRLAFTTRCAAQLGKGAIHVAVEQHLQNMVSYLLLELGADIDIPTDVSLPV